jgi:hypothetical protein
VLKYLKSLKIRTRIQLAVQEEGISWLSEQQVKFSRTRATAWQCENCCVAWLYKCAVAVTTGHLLLGCRPPCSIIVSLCFGTLPDDRSSILTSCLVVPDQGTTATLLSPFSFYKTHLLLFDSNFFFLEKQQFSYSSQIYFAFKKFQQWYSDGSVTYVYLLCNVKFDNFVPIFMKTGEVSSLSLFILCHLVNNVEIHIWTLLFSGMWRHLIW